MKKVLKKLKLNKKGFTFAECIVAIALFAIVGTLAFTMFNTSARYMSKARKEEAKRSEAQELALKEDFMNKAENGRTEYIIFSAKILEISYIEDGKGNHIANYSARIDYETTYGVVSYLFPIEPTSGEQPGRIEPNPFTRYQVISDKGQKRTIFIYDELDATGTLEQYWVNEKYN